MKGCTLPGRMISSAGAVCLGETTDTAGKAACTVSAFRAVRALTRDQMPEARRPATTTNAIVRPSQCLGERFAAALEAGFTRFRPVLMTALAMIIGMVPMALGLGDGGEQNAPLGRAVIGGLIFATVSTLLFVPAFFSVLQGSRRHASPTTQEQ